MFYVLPPILLFIFLLFIQGNYLHTTLNNPVFVISLEEIYVFFIHFIIKILAYNVMNLHMYSELVPFRTMIIIPFHSINHIYLKVKTFHSFKSSKLFICKINQFIPL